LIMESNCQILSQHKSKLHHLPDKWKLTSHLTILEKI
jgi:hypothetical protein